MEFEAVVPFAILLIPFIWIICAAAADPFTNEKGNGSGLGWILDFALGPIGLIVALLMPYKPKG